MIDVGRFFRAVFVSPVINSLPSTRIFFTSFPLIFIVPSSLTCAPGRRLTSSSTADPSGVRYAEALYTKVSSFSTTFLAMPVTTVSSSMTASWLILTMPRSMLRESVNSMLRVTSVYPTPDIFSIKCPFSGASTVNLPSTSVEVPVIKVLSAASRRTVAPMISSPLLLSTIVPLTDRFCPDKHIGKTNKSIVNNKQCRIQTYSIFPIRWLKRREQPHLSRRVR